MALLGPPEIRHAGESVAFPTRKAIALLAYLVVERGVHPREMLAALLWPESDAPHSRAALRYTLTCLRAGVRDAGGAAHLLEGKALGFNFSSPDELDLDLTSFQTATAPAQPSETPRALIERLQHAVDLWRGDFLEGFSVPDAPAFDEWVTRQTEAWHRRLESLFDRLSQAQANEGAVAQARETAERWAAASPLDERAQQRRIQLAMVAGDRAAALRAYQNCCDVFQRELGVAPAPETQALAQRARAVMFSSPTGEDGAGVGERSPQFLHPPFVGRADELARLVEAYDLARAGRARAAVVEGEAGIGKTRLATEFLAWATAQGADVSTGRAFEAGGRVPYQPLVDALRRRLERENAPDDLLSDVWLAELARLLPELRDRYPDLADPGSDEVMARARLFEAIARLGQSLAARTPEPVVLFVDDVQWGDSASLDVLRYVARRWAELGVSALLLLNVRTEALSSDPAFAEWLVGLGRELPFSHLTLGSLGAGETEELVRGLGVGVRDGVPQVELTGKDRSSQLADFACWLFGETRGQPFFVTETLKALMERGALLPRRRLDGGWSLEIQPTLLDDTTRHAFLPSGLRAVLRARLARLSPAGGTLLVSAAVLGQACSFELLGEVAELDDDEALLALDEALHGSLLREIGGTYLFAHDKIRDVVYADAGEARRRVFHRRALDVLQAANWSSAELAHHALVVGLDEPAFELSVGAGDEAMRVLAARDAVEHFERARAIAQRRNWTERLADLHVRFGKAFVSLAQWADARRELESALEVIGADRPERRAEVFVNLLEVCWWSLDLPTLRLRAAELRVLGENLDRADLQTAALSWLAPTVAADGDLAGCIALGERAVMRGHELGFGPPPPMHVYMAMPYYWLGRIEDAVERNREALYAARDANHTSATMSALPQLGMALAASGRYQEAASMFDEARRFGREYGIGTMLARAIAMSAGYHLDVFNFGVNEALAEEARELAQSLNFPPPAISAGLDLILNFARRQEVGRAEKLIPEVAEIAEKATAWHGWLWGLRLAQARAEIALERREWDAALSWATQAIAQCRLRGRVKYEAMGLTTRARAFAAMGRRSNALADAERAVGLARHMGDPALFVRCANTLLELGGTEALAVEAHVAAQRILAALPDDALRRSFAAAESVRAVMMVGP